MFAVVASVTATAANAQVVRLPWVQVEDILINDGSSFGGCMARVKLDVSRFLPNCRGGANSYVTFSCTGELQDQDAANRLFEVAQMGLITNREIRLEVDSNRQHNTYCLAVRAEIR